MPDPDVSVIIVAHQRREFLEEAVASAARAAAACPGTEVVVVKGFEDPPMEGRLAAAGARCFLEPAENVGAKLARGVRACRGSIVAVLEDDDLFEPEKLSACRELFVGDPTLGFLQHSVTPVDAQGKALPPGAYRGDVTAGLERLGRVVIRPQERALRLPGLPIDPYFSASAIVVRREVVLPHLAVLERINLVPDAFLFFAALCGPWTVALDPHPWTRFRVHGANTSGAGAGSASDFLTRMARWSRDLLPHLRTVEAMVEAHAGPVEAEQARGVVAVQEVYAVLRTVGEGRSEMREALAHLDRCRGSYSWRTHARVRTAGKLFRLSPGIARALYVREKSRGSEPR